VQAGRSGKNLQVYQRLVTGAFSKCREGLRGRENGPTEIQARASIVAALITSKHRGSAHHEPRGKSPDNPDERPWAKRAMLVRISSARSYFRNSARKVGSPGGHFSAVLM
jgi:hypothetical protein